MDGRRFDTLARLVSPRWSRRAALKAALGGAVKGATVAVGVSAANQLDAGTAQAARCATGLKRCGKACYDPTFQQCCGKGRDTLVCGDLQICSTATRTCDVFCCTTDTPYCCDCSPVGGSPQCQSTPCAETDCVSV
jgi:hypothetical protein